MPKKQSNYKTMNREMQNIINHAQALVEATSGELDDRIKSARDALNERLESARGEFDEIEDQFQVKVQAADQFIHQKPYQTIGGTFLAGLFLGWFMSRK